MSLTIRPNSDGSLTITCGATTLVYGGGIVSAPLPNPVPLPPSPDPFGPTNWPTAFVRHEPSVDFGPFVFAADPKRVRWNSADRAATIRRVLQAVRDEPRSEFMHRGTSLQRLSVVLETGVAVDLDEIVSAVRDASEGIPIDIELVVPAPPGGNPLSMYETVPVNG